MAKAIPAGCFYKRLIGSVSIVSPSKAANKIDLRRKNIISHNQTIFLV